MRPMGHLAGSPATHDGTRDESIGRCPQITTPTTTPRESMLQKLVADFFNERGRVFLDGKRDLSRAEKAFSRAAAIAPGWSVPWFNLGRVAKRQRRWRESLEWNRKAVERDSSDKPAWWNLGIAATALGDWPEARRAWTAYGVQLPPGE